MNGMRFYRGCLFYGLLALTILCSVLISTDKTLAADPLRADTAPIADVSDPGYNWTGFYLGGIANYGWGDVKDVNNPAATEKDINGWLGGATIGYNYQFQNNIVLGAEADWSFGDVGKDWGGTNQFDPYYGADKIKSFGTARLRAGYAFDRFLPYVTGGLAWADFEHSLGCDAARTVATGGCQNKPGGSAFHTSKSDTDLGWTVGVGAEYGVTQAISIKAEYLYADFGKHSVSLVDPNYPALSKRNFDSTANIFRVGVNYRF